MLWRDLYKLEEVVQAVRFDHFVPNVTRSGRWALGVGPRNVTTIDAQHLSESIEANAVDNVPTESAPADGGYLAGSATSALSLARSGDAVEAMHWIGVADELPATFESYDVIFDLRPLMRHMVKLN